MARPRKPRFGVLFAALVLAACPGPSAARRTGELMRVGLDALYQKHDAAAAAASFRAVLAIDGDHYGATFQLAYALQQEGRMDEARPVWEKVARMAEGRHDATTAATARRFLAAGAPGMPDELMKAGLQALYGRHDPVAAAEIFRRVLAANPDHYGANFQLASALDLAGDRAEARPYWEKVLRLATLSGDRVTAGDAQRRLARR